MRLSKIIFIMFLIQLTIQFFSSLGILKYINTDAQHEDMISTLLFCTAMIVLSIEKRKHD